MITSDALWFHAAQRPEKPAIVWNGKTYDYGALAARTRRLANALVGLGVEKGDRVGLLATNCVEHTETVFALAEIGAVWVPLNYRLAPGEVEYILGSAGCTAVVYTGDLTETVEAVGATADGVRHWIGVGAGARIGTAYDDLLARASDAVPLRRATPDDLAAIQHTSGTTGRPKGATLTHRQMAQGYVYSVMEYGARRGDVALQLLAQFHAGGNTYFMQQLMVGSTIHVHAHFEPDLVLRTIEKERVTYMGMVPSMLIFLLESNLIGKTDASSLERIQYGASPIPVDRLARANDVFDCNFQGIYGQTETAVFCTHLTGADHREAIRTGNTGLLESCGRTVLGYRLTIADDDDRALPPGEIGEILVAGESMMSGYWNNEEATAQTLRGGRVHTGDMARLDDQGYVYIVDRKKDLIVSGGENVYPVEVENIISAHPDVLEVAVIGVPDQRWVESVKAVVAPRPGAKLAEKEIIDFCRGKLGGFKIPKSIDFVDALPRTPTGKVTKNVLREPYWKDQTRRV